MPLKPFPIRQRLPDRDDRTNQRAINPGFDQQQQHSPRLPGQYCQPHDIAFVVHCPTVEFNRYMFSIQCDSTHTVTQLFPDQAAALLAVIFRQHYLQQQIPEYLRWLVGHDLEETPDPSKEG
mmetsp:Transcript_35054/g.63091  ORF Transcript_35054/g.63091 Transcript_35054/m.63091 type:complete len:122 (+) Transcript_35054:128-493(+)